MSTLFFLLNPNPEHEYDDRQQDNEQSCEDADPCKLMTFLVHVHPDEELEKGLNKSQNHNEWYGKPYRNYFEGNGDKRKCRQY